MFTEFIEKVQASQKNSVRRLWLPLFIALVFALTIHPGKVQAQVIGNLEVNIPFQFHAGNAKLPAGKYIIHVLDDSDLSVMEIMSADGTTSALFNIEATQADSTPAKTEVTFNKYGDRYFLAKVFDEGSPDGSQVVKSAYEKKFGQGNVEVARVPAHHRGQQGS
jgi:hypothetical protein